MTGWFECFLLALIHYWFSPADSYNMPSNQTCIVMIYSLINNELVRSWCRAAGHIDKRWMEGVWGQESHVQLQSLPCKRFCFHMCVFFFHRTRNDVNEFSQVVSVRCSVESQIFKPSSLNAPHWDLNWILYVEHVFCSFIPQTENKHPLEDKPIRCVIFTSWLFHTCENGFTETMSISVCR